MAGNIVIPASGTGDTTPTVATDRVAVTGGAGTGDVQFVKLVDGTAGGTSPIPGDNTNGLYVNIKAAIAVPVTDNSGSLTVDNNGTFATQATLAAETTKVIGTVNIASGQSVQSYLGDIINNQVLGGGSKTDTTDQSIMVASGNAAIYNYLCWVAIYNASATNTYVNVKDGSTVRLVLPLPAYGGAVFNLPYPIKGTGNTAWNLASGASVTTAYLYGGGYKGA